MCDKTVYTCNMHEIVSRVAYLAGVERYQFSDGEHLQESIFSYMDGLPTAKDFRALGIIRNCILKQFKEIDCQIVYELKNLDSIVYVDQDALSYLKGRGIMLQKPNTRAWEYLMDINALVMERDSQIIKECFPDWIDHGFLKLLFRMDVSSEAKIKAAERDYRYRKYQYPFQTWLNFRVTPDMGNILFNDAKFVKLLYASHGREFTDMSKVKGSADLGLEDFNAFMGSAGDVCMMVDCENTDAYKLYAMLEDLRSHYPEDYSKIRRIALYDDIHTSNAWKLLHRFTDIPISHMLTERVLDSKSLVDIQLSAGICKTHYRDGISDFIIVSSDSDYFALMNSMAECRFLMAVEKENVSGRTIDAVHDTGTGICFLDSFCTGSLDALYVEALKLGVRSYLEEKTAVPLEDIARQAAKGARLEIDGDTLTTYMDRIRKGIHVNEENGQLMLTV